jgi:hypothetical protein
MPLYDHFHKPLLETRQWISFHARWATAIADDLNRRLPRRFLAEAPFSLGKFASADVAEIDEEHGHVHGASNGAPYGETNGGVAVAAKPVVYTPPKPDATFSADFPPEVIVEIRDLQRTRKVLAVIEIVSPGNKDDDNARLAFGGKCLSYLANGIGLLVLDIVTLGSENLHNVMMQLAHQERHGFEGNPQTYAASYRPGVRKREDIVDVWRWPLSVGEKLPAVPLALSGVGCIELDLEATYSEACERNRIP